MKKVLATLVLVLVASTVSAAEVKIGAWGRGFFVPYYSDGASDAKSFDAVSWGAGNPRVGISISGTSDNVGFQIDMNADGGAIGAHDQQKIWVKPIDMLTVSVGRVYDDTLRGNGCFGDFDWLRISGTGEDLTFSRVSTHDGPFGPSTIGSGTQQGAVFAIDPMKELHAYVAFRGMTSDSKMEDAMKNVQVGAGYTIGTLGQFRAQYIGRVTPEVEAVAAVANDPATPEDETVAAVAKVDEVDASVINAAFKLTMVQNLYADLGIFFPLDKDGYGRDMTLAAYVKYTMGAIGIHGLANVSMGATDSEGEDATAMEFAAGFDYAIGNGLGFVSSFRYQNDASAGVKDGRMGALLGIEKGFSNGKIGAGIEFATTTISSMPEVDKEDKIASEEMSIAIPVKVEYWF